MKEEYIVGLHMERREEMSESHTVRLGIYRAESYEEAFQMADREFAVDGWKVGARTGGPLDQLRRLFVQGEAGARDA